MVELKKAPGNLFTVLGLIVLTAITAQAAEARDDLRGITDGLRARLGLQHAVDVIVVASDPHLASAVPPTTPGLPFIIRVESRLLETLDREELEAVLAHELGHVWVYTHHPYLQTELGANEIALRVVSRDALSRVYDKVWSAGLAKGNRDAFLPTAVAPAAGAPTRPQ